jgi:alkylation response protein AidB-like acyl-CoA dehydrogenase
MAANEPEQPLESFRAEVRAWLEQNYPLALRTGGDASDGPALSEARKAWTKAICARGWATPTWPKAYGGGGLELAQANVLRQEMRRIGAASPIAGGMGVRMLGPTLLEYGSEAQKLEHVPRITRGESRWCQGYSEPNAGSDLASLQTRAEDKGDHFLVNGQKIWTSGANFADWCFCLVRTDTTRKHEGISFLLIDMRSEGVEVRPIQLISGNSPFCETFFRDVKVPKQNLVGELNRGWTIGKRLLQFERQRGEDRPPANNIEGRPVQVLATEYIGVDDSGVLSDGDLRARITNHLMEMRALVLTLKRVSESRGANGPSTTTSILKNVSSKVSQDRAELVVEILGADGLGWDGEAFTKEELGAVRQWLSGKATTIYAGSWEIQNNIIAKRILGLPDPTSGAS